MLNWTSHEHIIGCLTAIGLRGVYIIQRVGPEWILSGQGHDNLDMLAIPPIGRPFTHLQTAQDWASRLDQTRTVEPQASGA